jgi:hypothetical protein
MIRRAVVLAAVLVSAACSEDPTTQTNAMPVQAPEAPEEDFSEGVSIQCAPLDGSIAVSRATTDDLQEIGGTIADGRWVLSASTLVGDDDPEQPPAGGRKAAVLSFSGKEVAWASDTDVYGNAKNECCRGTYAVDGTEMTLRVRCSDGNEEYVLPFGIDGTTLRLRTTGNEYVETYSKR